MHTGLKGTMNELFLQDLAAKTKRGLRGRVENGKSGGGISYGYRMVKKFDANGEAIRGDREIAPDQAEVIRRIFCEYANDNKSPKAIASDLNSENIPCPSGKAWGQSTINGNRKRGTGILNNHLYIGELVWNRQRFIKDPSSGKRVARPNPESEWIRQDVPDLRIVDQELWDAVKARQKELDKKSGHLGARKRPQYLLSGLLECGSCGGGFAKVNSERYGCSAARNKGESVCTNKITIKRENLEGVVLSALQTHLMRPELVELFCAEYTKHMNVLIAAQHQDLKRLKSEQSKIEREKANIIDAIKRGIDPDMVKDELDAIKQRQIEIEAKMKVSGHEPQPFVHPAMASRYHAEVNALIRALQDQEAGGSAQHIRGLIEKIILTPKIGGGELQIDLHGDLAGILKIATEDQSMKGRNEKRPVDGIAKSNAIYRPSVQLVAGAGYQLYRPLFTALDIARQPPTASTLLSTISSIVEGACAFKGADYSNTLHLEVMAGGENG